MRLATIAFFGLVALPFTGAVRARSGAASQISANPIRKVVNLLQAMQKKVQAEGEAEEKLYKKFKCYCKTGGKELSASISAAEEKAPMLSSDIEASSSKLSQLKDDVKTHQDDRASAKDAIAKATAIREKEAAAHAAEKGDYEANIAAIAKAVAALEKGMAGSFLQTPAAQVLKQLVTKEALMDSDREELMSFLSTAHGSGYVPQSGQITGILKQMGDNMAKGLADATAEEEAAIKAFEELTAAKTKELVALTQSIETKSEQIGEVSVGLVQKKEDLSDTEDTLAEDKKFLANLDASCDKKDKEWEERSKTRAEELVALAETIKVLNDDDALELFKKTLPGTASFVQLEVTAASLRSRALDTLRKAQRSPGSKHRAGFDLLVLALSGKKALAQGGFEKVIAMIDNMVEMLKTEQSDDDSKKEYCGTQFDLSDDKKKALERKVADEEKAIETTTEAIKTTTDEIASLKAGIEALDKYVAEATEQRKEEHTEYNDLMASNTAAKELLVFAKNRLNKFYNPKLYKAPPKAELSSEDRIYSNMGGSLTTTTPGGIADTGITVESFAQLSSQSKHKAAAPGPPPETWDAYATKSQETTGVISMIDLLIKDLVKEMTEAETEEKDGQADYEQLMKDSAGKRTADSKALAEKEGAKADLEEALDSHKTSKKDASSELMITMEYIQSLHSECDWLMQYFTVRKEARSDEIDSLKNAKAVLSGADYSLIQTSGHSALRGTA